LTSGTPKAGSGTTATELATTARDDGIIRIVYHGHPLYPDAGESRAGDVTGEGPNQFGAE
jgi:predicted lipoprotein with Yx(FWY)xxD motif